MRIRKFPFVTTWMFSFMAWLRSSYLFVPITGLAVLLFALGAFASRILIVLAGMFYNVVGEGSFLGLFHQATTCTALVACTKNIPQMIVLLIKNIGRSAEYFFLLLAGLAFVALAALVMAAFLSGYSRMALDLVKESKTELVRFLTSAPLAPRMLAAAFMYLVVILFPIALMVCLFAVTLWLSSALAPAWLGWLGIDILYIADVFVVPGLLFIVLPLYALSARMALFPFFIVDQRLGVFESLIASFEATAGNTIRMVCTSLFFLLSFWLVPHIGPSWLLRTAYTSLYLLFVLPFQIILFARIYISLAEQDDEYAVS